MNSFGKKITKSWKKFDFSKITHLLATTNYTTFEVYRLSEGDKVKLLTLTHRTQLNCVTLGNHGFSAAAKIQRLFIANRQTKTLS